MRTTNKIKSTFGHILKKSIFDQHYFDFWESCGIHITPVHYFSPIPDTRELSKTIRTTPLYMRGVQFNIDKQFNIFNDMFPKYQSEYNTFPDEPTNIPHEFFSKNGTYLSYDAEILHCMIRHYKPSKIIEIGSGNTMYISANALLINDKEMKTNSSLISIEPYPNEVLINGFPGLTKLEKEKVENIDPEYFKQLKENDILFIDSSHVVKTGGDVNKIYLEILPLLNSGVIVHFHDIFLPSEYPQSWLFKTRYFWSEQYLLHAFLLYNNEFEIIWSSHLMHLLYGDVLKDIFPKYPDERYPDITPSSFWIRKK